MNTERRIQKAEERLKKHEKALAEKKKALESLKKSVKELSKAVESERAEVEHIKMESLVELMNKHQVTFEEIEQAITSNIFTDRAIGEGTVGGNDLSSNERKETAANVETENK